MFKAGPLRHYIQLQEYSETRSASGFVTHSWSTYATVWARIRTLSGQERIAAQQASNVLTHEVTIRYRDDVQPDHRILFGSRIFDIKDIRNVDELGVEIRMLATEILSGGPAASGSPSSSASASPSSSASAS